MRIKKFVEVKCAFCKAKVLKEQKEYKRRIKKGKNKFYCNLSCAAKDNPILVENAQYNQSHRKESYLKLINSPNFHQNSIDELTPFRILICNCKSKAKQKEKSFDITVQDLKLQWDIQKGICPYTGYPMILPSRIPNYIKGSTSPFLVSIDRIDSSLGYLKGNVELVCVW